MKEFPEGAARTSNSLASASPASAPLGALTGRLRGRHPDEVRLVDPDGVMQPRACREAGEKSALDGRCGRLA